MQLKNEMPSVEFSRKIETEKITFFGTKAQIRLVNHWSLVNF